MDHNKASELLGVDINASEATIKQAFKKLARKHHPDKGGDPAKFMEVKDAYDFLDKTDKNSQDQSNFSSYDEDQWREFSKNMGPEWRFMWATKEDYLVEIEQILNDARLDIKQNMSIISALDEDTLERLASALSELQEQNCLTEITLKTILIHINFPTQDEFDTFNPHAAKMLIDHYISKNDLIAPYDVSLDDSRDILKAFQLLSGDHYEGSQCWPKPSTNLMNQDNLNLLFTHPKLASDIAGSLTCLDRVGLLSNENKTFLSTFAEQASITFGSLAYSFADKNKLECEKILVNAQQDLDWHMERRRKRELNKTEQQAPTSPITPSFKDKLQSHKKGINDYSEELAQFTDNYAAWIKNRPQQFEQLKELLKEGILTGDNLNKFHIYTIFLLTDKKNLDNAMIAFNEGLMTPESIDSMFKTLEAMDNLSNVDYAEALLSENGLDAMRKGLISPQDTVHFYHSNDLYAYINESLKQYNLHKPINSINAALNNISFAKDIDSFEATESQPQWLSPAISDAKLDDNVTQKVFEAFDTELHARKNDNNQIPSPKSVVTSALNPTKGTLSQTNDASYSKEYFSDNNFADFTSTDALHAFTNQKDNPSLNVFSAIQTNKDAPINQDGDVFNQQLLNAVVGFISSQPIDETFVGRFDELKKHAQKIADSYAPQLLEFEEVSDSDENNRKDKKKIWDDNLALCEKMTEAGDLFFDMHHAINSPYSTPDELNAVKQVAALLLCPKGVDNKEEWLKGQGKAVKDIMSAKVDEFRQTILSHTALPSSAQDSLRSNSPTKLDELLQSLLHADDKKTGTFEHFSMLNNNKSNCTLNDRYFVESTIPCQRVKSFIHDHATLSGVFTKFPSNALQKDAILIAKAYPPSTTGRSPAFPPTQVAVKLVAVKDGVSNITSKQQYSQLSDDYKNEVAMELAILYMDKCYCRGQTITIDKGSDDDKLRAYAAVNKLIQVKHTSDSKFENIHVVGIKTPEEKGKAAHAFDAWLAKQNGKYKSYFDKLSEPKQKISQEFKKWVSTASVKKDKEHEPNTIKSKPRRL